MNCVILISCLALAESPQEKPAAVAPVRVTAPQLAAAYARSPERAQRDYAPTTTPGRDGTTRALEVTGYVAEVLDPAVQLQPPSEQQPDRTPKSAPKAAERTVRLESGEGGLPVYVMLNGRLPRSGDLLRVTARAVRYDPGRKALTIESSAVGVVPPQGR
jgi:hypothetical protein